MRRRHLAFMTISTISTISMISMISAFAISAAAAAGESGPPKLMKKPTAVRQNGTVRIEFAVAAPTDVEVAILDAAGKVVRHLAAGVLGGKNAPPEPLKRGLAQTLAWDGKDDFGKPVGPDLSGFTVRVRAGMGVKFGRTIGGSPYTGQVTTGAPSDSLAVDEEGGLYVKMGSFVPQLHQAMPWQIRKFDKAGQYAKTVLPYPPSTDPARTPGFNLIDAGDGLLTPANSTPLDPVLFNFGDNIYRRPVDGRLVFVDSRTAALRFLKMDGSNALKVVPMRSAPDKLKWARWLAPQVAFSPDGRYAYYSNVANTPYDGKRPSDIDPNWPQGRVYRHDISRPGADPERFYDLELPDWEKTKYWMPSAWDKKTAAGGIDVDLKGNVLVCDLVNQEVVEVSPEGKKISATKVPWPDKVMVGGKDGALYVVSRKVSRGYPPPAALLKIVGRGAGARVVARLQLKGALGQSLALDESGEVPADDDEPAKPVIWLAGGGQLVRVQDRGTELAPSGGSILNRDKDAIAFVCYADVDAEADLVYVTEGMGRVWRFNGETGGLQPLARPGKARRMAVADRTASSGSAVGTGPAGGLLPIRACDLAVGPGGMVYAWGTTGTYKGPVARYTRHLKPAPLPATGKHTYGYLDGRYGRGNSVCGLDVDLQGRVFAVYGGNDCHVRVYDADGNLVPYDRKVKSSEDKAVETPAAITGISGRGGSIRVDRAGNIYVLQHGLPKDFKPPRGFQKDRGYLRSTGTIYKFGPEGGEFTGKGWSSRQPAGALQAYPGCAPISGAWASTISVCVCTKPRFDVDLCGRLYVPNAMTFKVTVLDNAGNEILTFGGYGNFDSQGPKSKEPKPEIPLGWPVTVGASDRYIYVGDGLNHRIVRVDKTCAAEALCAVK